MLEVAVPRGTWACTPGTTRTIAEANVPPSFDRRESVEQRPPSHRRSGPCVTTSFSIDTTLDTQPGMSRHSGRTRGRRSRRPRPIASPQRSTMSNATTATRRPLAATGGSRQALIGLVILVASFCSVGPLGATAAAHQDDGHVTASADYRRHRYSHRLRRRAAHPVRRQARRRSRCLAHTSRPVHQRPRHVVPAIGPPVHRGPPTR